MRGKLIRIERSKDGVFGVLTLNGQLVCWTLERPWLNNAPNVSCIPPDIYVCNRIDSPKFKETFEVFNVPGRSHILFHIGNTIDDSLGCILPGSEIGEVKGKRGVLESGKAFFALMTALEGVDMFPLQIINF